MERFFVSKNVFFSLQITLLKSIINDFVSLIINVTIITVFDETNTPTSNQPKTTALEFKPSKTTNKPNKQ